MTRGIVSVWRHGSRWMYSCRHCLNQPGFGGLNTWELAMHFAEQHVREWHPVIDWDAVAAFAGPETDNSGIER